MGDSGRVASLLEQVLSRLDAIEAKLGGEGPTSGGGNGGKPAMKEDPKSIRAYDAYLRECLDPFVEAAKVLGPQAVAVADVVKEGWAAQRDFLLMASQVKEPAAVAKVQAKLSGVTAAVQKAQKAVQRGDFENQGRAVAEGMQCLTWVVVKPAPRDYIENFVGASDFWGNKVRVQFKKTNPEQMAFVDTFKKLLLELMPYVKEWHTTGVAWNAQGMDIDAYVPGGGSPPPAAPSTTPTPTNAPPTAAPTNAAQPEGGRKALFGELSQGLGITSGLKKVTKDQQTWRPEFKQGGNDSKGGPPPPPAPTAAPPASSSAAAKKAAAKGPPRSSYDPASFRHNIENYVEGVTTVEVADKNQSVYIYGCGPAVIDVRGKGKSVTIDGCKRTQVIVDELLSSLEVVNCQGVKVQVRNKVPTVAIDKTDGIVVILSKDGLETSFVTSKSSEMNIQYPRNDDGDLAEMPIPEQWQHRLKGGATPGVLAIENSVSDLYG